MNAEKQLKKNQQQRLPGWLQKKNKFSKDLHSLKTTLRKNSLNTVCESARCPNIGECFSKPTAAFMIMGDICTRSCGFCSVDKGIPLELDQAEPYRIAETVNEMGLKHVVITSVTRDDLSDGGAGHFASVVKAIKDINDTIKVEVLTPDFRGDENKIKTITDSKPDIFNHNVETVSRLYKQVRPESYYEISLGLFKVVKSINPEIVTKSGLMVGLGETKEEVVSLLEDLNASGCDIVTIGQYLQPTLNNLPVFEYVNPGLFEWYKKEAGRMKFKGIEASPFTRSSYNAEEKYNHILA